MNTCTPVLPRPSSSQGTLPIPKFKNKSSARAQAKRSASEGSADKGGNPKQVPAPGGESDQPRRNTSQRKTANRAKREAFHAAQQASIHALAVDAELAVDASPIHDLALSVLPSPKEVQDQLKTASPSASTIPPPTDKSEEEKQHDA